MRRPLRPALPARHAEGGFTLVEMTISVTLMAVIALALAAVLHSGLRALGAAKARAQGNEVATHGIEDLQRYGFNDLGVCGTHTPATPPPGVGALTPPLSNCPATLPTYDCNAGTSSIPLAQYTCRRNNIDYTVRRYVAWVDNDPLHTAKRLAVFVDWDDLVGRHQVSQQSSLRAPDQAAIVGLAPPAFATPIPSAMAAPNPLVLAPDGRLSAGSAITLNAATQNLSGAASTSLAAPIPPRAAGERFNITVGSAGGFPDYNGYPVNIGGKLFTVLAGAGTTSWLVSAETSSSTATSGDVKFDGDRVYANLDTIDPVTGDSRTSAVFLTSANGTSWVRTVGTADDFVFSAGKQYVSFGILRAADGKSSIAFSSTAMQFCPNADPNCLNLRDPVVTAPTLSAVGIDSGGALEAPLTITATTKYMNTGDAVTVTFGTSAGAVSMAMAQDPLDPCLPAGSVRTPPGGPCTWTVTIPMTDGHRFTTGAQSFYVKARQLLPDSDPNTVDYLSTDAAVATVTFQ